MQWHCEATDAASNPDGIAIDRIRLPRHDQHKLIVKISDFLFRFCL